MADPQQTGVPDGWTVVSAPPPPAPSKGHDFKVLGVNIHVPGEEKPRADSNMIGWGDQGAGVAPEDALMAGQAARAVVQGASNGAFSGVKAAVTQAAPAVKYEATKTLLEKMGVPTPLATVAAMAVAGYKKGAKGEPVAAPTASPSAPVTAPVAPAPQAAPVARTATPPLSAGSPPSAPGTPRTGPDGLLVGRPGGNPAMPDQKALNEAALAARRAAYQQRLAQEAQAAAQTPAPAAKPKLMAAEAPEYMRLLRMGKTHAEAMETIEQMRSLQQQLGTPTPTAADTRFPKGMRGKGSV